MCLSNERERQRFNQLILVGHKPGIEEELLRCVSECVPMQLLCGSSSVLLVVSPHFQCSSCDFDTHTLKPLCLQAKTPHLIDICSNCRKQVCNSCTRTHWFLVSSLSLASTHPLKQAFVLSLFAATCLLFQPSCFKTSPALERGKTLRVRQTKFLRSATLFLCLLLAHSWITFFIIIPHVLRCLWF